MLPGPPSTSRGLNPAISMACASSVTTRFSALARDKAAVRSPWRNAWGVNARHMPSRSTVLRPPRSSLDFSVSATGSASNAPCESGSASRRRARSPASRQGRAASCTRTQSRGDARPFRAASPFSTETWRSGPPVQTLISGASGNSRARRAAITGQCASSPAMATTMPAMRGSLINGRRACSITLRPARDAYCLRCAGMSAAPNRSPRPAAGTTAQHRSADRVAVIASARSGLQPVRSARGLRGSRPGKTSRRCRSFPTRSGHVPPARSCPASGH